MGSAGTTVATDELIISTLDQIGDGIWDQTYEKVPTFDWLNQKGKVNKNAGGYTQRFNIRTGKNTSSGKTSGYKTVLTNPVDTIDEVLYQLATYYATVTYSEELKNINSGEYAKIDLINDKISDAQNSIIDNVSTDLFASSIATDALNSLVYGIDSTGAIGGVNQSTISSWASYEASAGSFAAGGLEAMQLAYNTVGKGKKSGKPDLIVTTQTVFQYLQSTIRAFGGDWQIRKGDLGVEEIMWSGTPVIWDPDCASQTMLFLNSNALSLAIDGKANMKSTPFTKPADQMAYVGQIYCRLNVQIKERRALGKLTGVTA